MKVFLSWSGDVSRAVAEVFKEWLPSVLQFVEPYVSSEDIDKGARWATDIAKELEASSFGIVCVTKENLGAPWVHFEAGALSKAVEKARVVPFLLGVKRHQLSDPLKQFQSALYTHDDLRKLVFTLNTAADGGSIEETRLEEIFEVWWPKLQERLEPLTAETEPSVPGGPAAAQAADTGEQARVLEELLELGRAQLRLLSNPEELLPPSYLRSVGRPVSATFRRRVESFIEVLMREVVGLEGQLGLGDVPKSDVEDAARRIIQLRSWLQETAVPELLHGQSDESRRGYFTV